ncbi:DNA repair protein RecN [Paradesertivirga mongoliensis]|uniref:DNA repair protein RecN n=1 Tax=Paradesertivirga mongoliensis TaxID=2100740 RepID=A0ABW4ZFU6_9SPHI|nr:DNA repair protein RecN [Pedobacter mongoliensis]
MLNRLIIQNYALIDDLDISFSKGLNILTGETGAGKSIILGALSLILGNRVEGRYFFNQQKKCIIEGSFKIDGYKLQDFFGQNELDYETETVLRREISSEGKSRAFINDTPVNLATLKQLGELLIDIHSQHATFEINNESFQRLVVDTLAANEALLKEYQKLFNSYKEKKARLSELIDAGKKANIELDYLQFQFEELEKVNLIEGEQEKLEHELQTLSHAEEIKRNLLGASYLLSESEQAVIARLRESLTQVQQAGKYLPESELLAERLQSSLIELKDIVSEIELLEQKTVVNEARSSEISTRLSSIYSLQKKHHVNTVTELLEIQRTLSDKIESISFTEEEISSLEEEVKNHHAELLIVSETLSASRTEIIPTIENKVKETLAEVGMLNSVLKINNQLLDENSLNAFGRNKIEFFFSANKGQEPAPMSKVASGGELSRLMLSIKSLITTHIALPTIIFDEIDTGISGEVALKVGVIMERLSANMQVIAITHLPQIASKGEAHYCVYKDDREDKTHTNIRLLNGHERVLEIGKMLSGETPGEAALQHAKELLSLSDG